MRTMSVSLGGGSYNVRPAVLRTAGGGRFDVAVITVRDDASNARQLLARRLAAALMYVAADPGIERLLQTDYPGQHGFSIVTAWPDGGDLRVYLAANPTADVLDIARKIATALRHLHPRVVHGNLDLSSVFMHGHSPRIWDFTLCRLTDPESAAGPLVDLAPATREREGVITAIAPELDIAATITPASDVYAFGILLFELFARQRPFASVSRLGAAILFYEGRRPAREDFPLGARADAVWAIIPQCWAQDPGERPNMAQVEADLHLVS